MTGILAIAGENLLSPMVLFFALGFAAAMVRSDLSVPEAVAKGLSLYLLLSIGFKGGAGVAEYGASGAIVLALLAGIVLSAVIPFVAFAILSAVSSLDRINAAAVAAHYGSISIVTFVAATSMLTARGIPYEGYMVAVAAVMEAPAIVTALVLVHRTRPGEGGTVRSRPGLDGALRARSFSQLVVPYVGAFAIAGSTDPKGLAEISRHSCGSRFKGVLWPFPPRHWAHRGTGDPAGGRSTSFYADHRPVRGRHAAGGGRLRPRDGAWPSGSPRAASPCSRRLAASASYIAVPGGECASPCREANPGPSTSPLIVGLNAYRVQNLRHSQRYPQINTAAAAINRPPGLKNGRGAPRGAHDGNPRNAGKARDRDRGAALKLPDGRRS